MEISNGIDIAAYSMSYASAGIMSSVSIAMLDKTLDMQQMMGDNLTKMMEMSVNPSVGGTIDIRV